MRWKQKSFQQLTTTELYAIIQARMDVFVVEQQSMYQDLDGIDLHATHLFLSDEDGSVQAYARFISSGILYREASIGRILTRKESRGKGLSHLLMQQAMTFLLEEQKETAIRLQAEYYIRALYEQYGFIQVSEIFIEDGIEHVYMVLKDVHAYHKMKRSVESGKDTTTKMF
ncbi:GNAT family N-acetyltransferase [Bacillus sp. C1-1]|nr:GNAT family N-acetyltransferase [Bacillus sp. C1-1]